MQNKSSFTGRLDAKAFTLIELLVVVLIIGILAAVALPQYRIAVEKARAMQALTMVQNIVKAQEAYFAATGQYATDFDELSIEVPGASHTASNSQPRRLYGNFSFGISMKDFPAIAIALRCTDGSDNCEKADYAFERWPNDKNIYCFGQHTADPLRICERLSNGKRGWPEGLSYFGYVVNF